MEPKITSVETYLGLLEIGDTVTLSWDPSTMGIYTKKVLAIWKSDGWFYLAFDKDGIKTYNACYGYNGKILEKDSLLKIIKGKVTNWKKVIQNGS